ncbi:cation-translocating P-type ATPase [Halobacteriovorax sp. HLS]|uniref:heavy metal translocating P-type ATPase n=1 Tax=Halobacteriovorax sp. HLS TaxID=2234000 RepID=UPI000FD8C6D7|nr:heavy metal translocating P-type ATPase [Halobacteriovorax sp. HLS]
MSKVTLAIGGMSCASCALSIEAEVKKIDGVLESSVNYATETAYFEISDDKLLDVIKSKVQSLGFSTSDELHTPTEKTSGENYLVKFYISIALSLLLFSLAMWPLMGWPNREVNWFIQLVLCLPIWAWIGLKFQKSLVRFFLTGKSNMNTLIGLGTTAAFVYSAIITVFNDASVSFGLTQKVYFEAVGFIISFVYLGNYFEERAKRKTKEALNSLFKLSSKKALVEIDSKFVEVDIDEVQKGSVLRVKPGEKFPVDGKILRGSSLIDESMITGEPVPLLKSSDDLVYSGTINGDSVIEYIATKVGKDTFLSQIIAFVEQAQGSRPKIQQFADRISSIFTPVVIAISVLTFICWFFLGPEPFWGNAISNMIAVLVIACPCALGLATPTAVVVATGRASLKGILIGGGEIIERSEKIDTIIFDKTGTITEGRPSVVEALFNNDEETTLMDIASIEQFSEHPLSNAIVKYSQDRKIPLSEPDSFEIVKGKGIIASIDEREYVIGNKLLLEESSIEFQQNLTPNEIGSYVFVACNGVHCATLVVGDKIKSTSKSVIDELKFLGIETWMITGDNEIVAEYVAKELGIEHFVANALPLEKSSYVESLQAKGKNVAMIGDGVNDAPALAKANVSMAMGTGADVAMNASDVTLVKGDLSKAIDFLKLSHGTMKIIKQNLFLSMVYNSLLIPIAAGVLVIFDGPMMPPVLASIAMGLSSISVVSNSLRIKTII